MERDIKLSNVKGLLIFLVVLGHLISPYQEDYYGLYLFIYTFHMPLFVMMSGYFAKRTSLRKVLNLILLYLIFQPIYRYFIVLIGVADEFRIKYEHPYYQLWYLTSMIAWLLILLAINHTALKRVNKVLLVSVCFLIGGLSRVFAAPFEAFVKDYYQEFNPHFLSYQRTLYFLPYFILGATLSGEHMRKVYESLKAKRIIAATASIGLYIYYSIGNTGNMEKIFKGSSALEKMSGEISLKFINILIVYIIAMLMCYIIMNIITDKKCFLTKWGDRSLPIFIFHMFFARAMEQLIILDDFNNGMVFTVLFIQTIAITIIFSSEIFVKYTYYILNPILLYDKVISSRR